MNEFYIWLLCLWIGIPIALASCFLWWFFTDRKKRLYREHVWGQILPGGPIEEGGQCINCGAWATSQGGSACHPEG